ncbi:hypothetical protein Taro_049241 [Colocasia esculenta]|uniref:Phosphatidylinositol N-acetylglucosaminyltransferase subunit C n=1 Tax=Colocasia esculenta TaxID=4460 RepID=A0A843XAE3_COLES|nr:hypothetical protein [Colocasia esculenta]
MKTLVFKPPSPSFPRSPASPFVSRPPAIVRVQFYVQPNRSLTRDINMDDAYLNCAYFSNDFNGSGQIASTPAVPSRAHLWLVKLIETGWDESISHSLTQTRRSCGSRRTKGDRARRWSEGGAWRRGSRGIFLRWRESRVAAPAAGSQGSGLETAFADSDECSERLLRSLPSAASCSAHQLNDNEHEALICYINTIPLVLMEAISERYISLLKWKKIAYGGMQRGYDDNYTDESFLEDMVMNANVVKRDFLKVMLDSVSVSQYICIVAIVVCVWTYTLTSVISETSLLFLDIGLLGLGFLVLLLTSSRLSIQLLVQYPLNISFFISGLYVLAPIYHTLTRSISCDSIWALTVSLLVVHLFLHDYSGSIIRPPGALSNPTLTSNISLNASIVASVLIASQLPSRFHVFATMLFSLQIFLFAPLVTYCMKKYSFKLHLLFSFLLMNMALGLIFPLHRLLFLVFLGLLFFIMVVCPYWLIRIQEYKFEINGPWDEAKLCFDITESSYNDRRIF